MRTISPEQRRKLQIKLRCTGTKRELPLYAPITRYTLWSEAETLELLRLLRIPYSFSEAAKALTLKFNRPFTRSSVSGRLDRVIKLAGGE